MNDWNNEATNTSEPDAELDSFARQVVEAAMEVHRQLGPGYLESVYEEALCIELEARGIPFVRQAIFSVTYKGRKIADSRLDILVGNRLIVELKAVDCIAPIHRAQVISYLKMTGNKLALLINFNVPLLKEGIKRIILS
jgi:GxxExxY protein